MTRVEAVAWFIAGANMLSIVITMGASALAIRVIKRFEDRRAAVIKSRVWSHAKPQR